MVSSDLTDFKGPQKCFEALKMELSTNTYKMLLSNKDELMKVVNQIAGNINQTINESMDKLASEPQANKKRKMSKKRKLFARPRSYFTRSKRKYLTRTPSKNLKRVYLTKYSLNLIKKSIKGFVNELLI